MPPAPPSDAEQQAAQERQAAETAALVLFATVALGGQEAEETNEIDLELTRRIAERLVKAIMRMTMSAAGAPLIKRSVDDIAGEIVGSRNEPSSTTRELTKLVKALRDHSKSSPPPRPGDLSPQKAAARAFATHAYGKLATEVAAKLPVPDSFKARVLKKTWVTQSDNRVRDLHRRLHGRTKRFDADFWRWPMTGQRLRYPGDLDAPLSAIYGCRCVLWLSWNLPGEIDEAIRKLPPVP